MRGNYFAEEILEFSRGLLHVTVWGCTFDKTSEMIFWYEYSAMRNITLLLRRCFGYTWKKQLGNPCQQKLIPVELT